MTPVEWLERHYCQTFHRDNRVDRNEHPDYPGMYSYMYDPPQGSGSMAAGTMFTIKTDREELYFRDLGEERTG